MSAHIEPMIDQAALVIVSTRNRVSAVGGVSIVLSPGSKTEIIGFNDAVVYAVALKIRFLFAENFDDAFITSVVHYQKLTDVAFRGDLNASKCFSFDFYFHG